MRRRLAGALAVLGACVAFTMVVLAADAVLQELSVREADAHRSFFDLIWDGTPSIPGGQKVFKAASPEKQAAIVRGLGSLLKAYTRSATFKTQYAQYVEANRPRPDRDGIKSTSEQDTEMAEALQKMEADIKKMPPELQAQMRETVKQMKAQQDEMKKNTEYQSARESAVKQAKEAEAREYQERLATYNAEHPANHDVLIAARLKEFLALSGDVNFEAKLVKRGGLMRFEDPALESRPAEWKLCFRAGKQATDAARAFAAEWLKELPAK